MVLNCNSRQNECQSTLPALTQHRQDLKVYLIIA